MSYPITYKENPSQRQLCVLVLDASGSMSQSVPGTGKTRIQMLNDGVRALYEDLMRDEVARNRVRLAIVQVGGVNNDARVLMDWMDIMDFQPFDLETGGATPLAQGLRLSLQLIESEKISLRSAGIAFTRPWIFVMTDGGPTDNPVDWQAATVECRAAESANRCNIFPVGVDDADMDLLAQISARTSPIQMSAAKFKEFFLWLSASTKAASRSAPGDTVQLPSTSGWANVRS